MANLVTDRTAADVTNRTAKGVYAAADLNRVESAVRDLVGIAKNMGTVVSLSTKTDWSEPAAFNPQTWPARSQMQRYIDNVRHIGGVFAANLSAAPTKMDNLTWQGANEIEKVLQTAYTHINNTEAAYRYSGEFYAGGNDL